MLTYLLATLAGYLLGAFPTGYLACRLWCGIDIRQIGSGRTGGTNVLRSAGWGPAVLTVLGDAGKGYLAVALAKMLIASRAAAVVAGLAAVIGHNHSIFLGGMGGAGSMTNTGVLLALSPLVAVTSGLTSVAVLVISRIASLGSITLALLTPLLLWAGSRWGGLPAEYIAYGIFSSALTLYQLRPNIKRLIEGCERKIGEKPLLDIAPLE